MRIIRAGMALVLVATAVGCADLRAAEQASLSGRWQSEQPEPVPSASGKVYYLVRHFEFSGDHWAIDFTLFDDAETTVPVLHGRNEGRFSVASPTRRPDAARNAEFIFDARTLTPRTEAVAAALNRSGCGAQPWTRDVPQSVIENGCEAFRVFSKARCYREYDLVRVDGRRLFLGRRPTDGFLCSPDRRPADVGAPLIRVD